MFDFFNRKKPAPAVIDNRLFIPPYAPAKSTGHIYEINPRFASKLTEIVNGLRTLNGYDAHFDLPRLSSIGINGAIWSGSGYSSQEKQQSGYSVVKVNGVRFPIYHSDLAAVPADTIRRDIVAAIERYLPSDTPTENHN